MVGSDDPADGGAFVPCPFRALTGLWCPGCGLTRATHHLLRGDVGQALRYNAFVIVILAALTAVWLGWLLGAAGRPTGLRRMRQAPGPLYAGPCRVRPCRARGR